MEKKGAVEVLEAAGEDRLRTVVIRTEHVLGEPKSPVLKSEYTTTHAATREVANEALEEAVGKANSVLKGTRTAGKKWAEEVVEATKSVKSNPTVLENGVWRVSKEAWEVTKVTKPSYSALEYGAKGASKEVRVVSKGAKALEAGGKACKVAARVMVPVAVVIDVGTHGYRAYETEQAYARGEITEEERLSSHAENGAGMAGGFAGTTVGATQGATAGAAIGTFIFPGVGTTVGGFVGGVCGGIAGYMAGEQLGSSGADLVVGGLGILFSW